MGEIYGNNREFPRFVLDSVRARVDGVEYGVGDISGAGVFISGFNPGLAAGKKFFFSLHIPLMNKVAPVHIEGVVVRQTDRGLAVNYATPNRTWPQVLRVLSIKAGN